MCFLIEKRGLYGSGICGCNDSELSLGITNVCYTENISKCDGMTTTPFADGTALLASANNAETATNSLQIPVNNVINEKNGVLN